MCKIVNKHAWLADYTILNFDHQLHAHWVVYFALLIASVLVQQPSVEHSILLVLPHYFYEICNFDKFLIPDYTFLISHFRHILYIYIIMRLN